MYCTITKEFRVQKWSLDHNSWKLRSLGNEV